MGSFIRGCGDVVTGEGNGPVNGISGVSPLIKHMCVRLNNLEGEEN